MKKAIVLDLSVFNTEERLRAFFESRISTDYVSFLPSSIGNLIKEEKWNELIVLLRQWEWNLDRTKSEEWFRSSVFRKLCKRMDEVCISFETIKEELSQDERATISIIRDILGPGSPKLVELAKELVTIAVTKRAGILSFTRHLRRWLKSLRGVLILEISEKTNVMAAAKTDIKKRFRNLSKKGKIFVIFLEVIPSIALSTILPLNLHWLLKIIVTHFGKKLIIGVIINGVP